MKILACDTSSSVCAVGVFENDKLISKNELDNGRTHSENCPKSACAAVKDIFGGIFYMK